MKTLYAIKIDNTTIKLSSTSEEWQQKNAWTQLRKSAANQFLFAAEDADVREYGPYYSASGRKLRDNPFSVESFFKDGDERLRTICELAEKHDVRALATYANSIIGEEQIYNIYHRSLWAFGDACNFIEALLQKKPYDALTRGPKWIAFNEFDKVCIVARDRYSVAANAEDRPGDNLNIMPWPLAGKPIRPTDSLDYERTNHPNHPLMKACVALGFCEVSS